jgi:hypothetical protein
VADLSFSFSERDEGSSISASDLGERDAMTQEAAAAAAAASTGGGGEGGPAEEALKATIKAAMEAENR